MEALCRCQLTTSTKHETEAQRCVVPSFLTFVTFLYTLGRGSTGVQWISVNAIFLCGGKQYAYSADRNVWFDCGP